MLGNICKCKKIGSVDVGSMNFKSM